MSMRARLSLAILFVAGLSLTTAVQPGQPALANTLAARTVCGTVGGYSAATYGAVGSLNLNGTWYPIAINAPMSDAYLLTTGASVCVTAVFDVNGEIISGSVTSYVTTPVTSASALTVSVCGPVSAYIDATPYTQGTITINGETYGIAPGVVITGDSLIGAGYSVCLNGYLGPYGQIVSGTISQTAVSPALHVCGIVTGYVAASATVAGSIGIAGTPYPIATGVVVNAAITIGASYCLEASLNGYGQIVVVTLTGGVPLAARPVDAHARQALISE